MRRSRVMLIVLMMMVLIAGCATTPPAPTRTTPPTAMERAQMQSLLMMERYKLQLQDAESLERLVVAKKATAEQVKIYSIKRTLLIKAKKLIDTFDGIISDGIVPSVDKEQEIFDTLNRLVAAAG